MPLSWLTSWVAVAVVAAVFVPFWFAAFFRGRGSSYPFMDGEVHGVIGRMGQGKSMFVVTRVIRPAARALASERGLLSNTQRPVKRIITNFWIDVPEGVELIVLDGSRLWDHLCELIEWTWDPERERWSGSLDALVVLDEMHLYAPSGRMKMAPKAHWFCSMARKLNVEMWWLTQNQMKVHAQLRRDTTYIWRAQKGGGVRSLLPGVWFECRQYESEWIDKPKAIPVCRVMYRLDHVALSMYRSMDLIEPDEGVDLGLDSLSKSRQSVRDAVLVDADDAEVIPFGRRVES